MTEVEKKPGRRRRGCLIALGALVGISVIGTVIQDFAEKQQEPGALDQAESARANSDAKTLSVAQLIIKRSMKEPSSAEFSNGFGRLKHGSRVACGKVNGKNSFGAYSGAAPWLVIIDQDVAMIGQFDNARRFATLWNKYCTGLDDRDKPFPRDIMGVKLGSRPPAPLKPYDADKNVWVFSGKAPDQYLGVPIGDVSFVAQEGRLYGVQITSKAPGAYEKWRDDIRKEYGVPASSGSQHPPLLTWSWGRAYPHVQLSQNSTTGQTSLDITIR